MLVQIYENQEYFRNLYIKLSDLYVDKYGEAERFNILRFADRVPQPVLFVYGAIELQLTMFAGLPELLKQVRAQSTSTEVTVIDGADHNYAKREGQLGESVVSWLGTCAVQEA